MILTDSPQRHVLLEEQIKKLNAIGIALSGQHDLDKLLEMIVTEARSFTRADGGSLYIKEENKLSFRVAQTESLQRRDGQQKPFESFPLRLSKASIAGYVALTGEVLNIEDVYDIPPTIEYRINKQFDIQNNYRSQSMLVVPMRDHTDDIIGVLQLINSMNEDGYVVPFKPEYEEIIFSLASQAAVAIRNVKLIAEIKNLFRSLVRYSVKAIDARSPHTAGHSGRVAKYCVQMAEAINAETTGRFAEMKFTPNEIEELRIAALLHDIGKIGVRESVLEKTNKLNDDQIVIVEERFEAIRNRIQAEYLQKQIERERRNGSAGSKDESKAEMENKLAEVDRALAFIKQVNIPGFLRDEDRARLKEIAEQSYRNSKGEKCYYLTPREYENLSVIKGNLTESEYKEMQSHVEQTIGILRKISFTNDLKDIPKYAAAHHEYLDGSGYPLGLRGIEISLQSRIMCIADIYDALSSPDRPYKQAIPVEQTLEILRGEAAAGKVDRDIVELFIEHKLYQQKIGEEED